MNLTLPPTSALIGRLRSLPRELARFPWWGTVLTLRERFREDRLGLTASSLTFTTTMALVPFLTVVLAVFTAFPMFAKFQDVLQKWLIESLIPDNISRQVLGYLTQFAGKASKLGMLGVAILFGTALALIFTIDRTLNAIWRVRKPRRFGQRVLVYWTALTLGPLLLAVSLSLTSYAISASKGLVGGMPGGVQFLLDVLEFALLAGGMAVMYRYVPNTHVRWGHAWLGGLFVASGIELAKKLLSLYLSKVPTYSVIYGAFATVPILLVWIYLSWVIVLLGAVIAAYLPSLLSGVASRPATQGWRFQLAVEALQQLAMARLRPDKGLTVLQLAQALQADPLQVEPVMESLCALDWVGLLDESLEGGAARYILLADPDATPLQPLLQALLLPQADAPQYRWQDRLLSPLRLRDVL
jgi:membrane protein